MKKKLGLICFFVFIMMCSIAFAVDNATIISYSCDNQIFSEGFNYSDYFTNHGWIFSDGSCGNAIYTPIGSGGIFTTNSYGVNVTDGLCGFGYTQSIARNLPANITSGGAVISFNYSIQNNTGISYPFSISVDTQRTYSEDLIVYVDYGNLNNILIQDLSPTKINFTECTMNYSDSMPYTKNFKLEIDLDNDVYSAYLNGVSYGCHNLSFIHSPDWQVGSVTLTFHVDDWDGDEINRYYLDDLSVCEGSITDSTESIPYLGNCTDSDGTDYFTYGYVNDSFVPYLIYDECESNFSGNVSDTRLNEFICYLNAWDIDLKDCKDFGSDYYCSNGVCMNTPFPPSIASVKSFKVYDYIGLRWDSNNWYLRNENITYNVSAYDINGDAIYYAVDCDKNDGVGVTGWVTTPNTSICRYSNMTNYTARIYATDSYYMNYNVYMDKNISIRECYSPSGCTAGYDCQSGWCVLPTNVTSCIDSDGGQDKNVGGGIVTNVVARNDTCGSYMAVLEYYCSNSSPTGYYNTPLACDSWQYCYESSYGSYCTNKTGLTPMTLYVKDLTYNTPLSAISYVLTNLNNSVETSGTVTDHTTIALDTGNAYSLDLADNSHNYKGYYDSSFLATSSYTAKMERECSSPCVFKDVFTYTDAPDKHGWTNPSFYYTDYDTDIGMSLFVYGNSSLYPIYQTFPASTQNYVTITYDIVMSKTIPANGQDLWVYIRNGAEDIVLVRYYVDEVNGNKIYIWLDSAWVEVPATGLFFTNEPFRTKIVFNRVEGNFYFYVDKSMTGSYITYGEYVTAINNLPVAGIKILPSLSPYERTFLIDNIEITQSSGTSGGDEGTVTVPSSADLSTPFYTDSEGDVKFNREVCNGWDSFVMCAIFKVSTKWMANGVAWIFKGTHILFFIVGMLAIVLIGPLIVELFRPKR